MFQYRLVEAVRMAGRLGDLALLYRWIDDQRATGAFFRSGVCPHDQCPSEASMCSLTIESPISGRVAAYRADRRTCSETPA